MPGSPGLTLWRTLMIFVVLWACTLAPFELAFSWWEPNPFFKATTYFVDLMCCIDMVLNFFIASIKKGRLVTKKKKIAFGYLKSWFVIDLMTNIPWDVLLAQTGKSRKIVKVVKLPKIFRLTRLLRVAREEAHSLGVFFTLFGLLLLVHYISCMWAVLLIDCPEDYSAEESEKLCPGIVAAYFEGLAVGMSTLGGSDSWMRFIIESGRAPGQTLSNQPTGFVWKQPGVFVELSAAVTCLLGVCGTGLLFANIARAMDEKDAHTRKFNERLRNVKEAFLQHEIPEDIYNRARKHFHYVWSCGSDASRSLLEDKTLSLDLRRELAFSFYGDMLRKVPFLEPAEASLLKQISRYARMEVFSPRDNIILAGETADKLFFIVAGCVKVVNQKGESLRRLEEGSFFGEMALFFEDYSHQVNVVGSTFGCVLTVEREILQDLCSEDLLEAFRTVAVERNENILEDTARVESLKSMTLDSLPGKHGAIQSGSIPMVEEDCVSDAASESPKKTVLRVHLEGARSLRQAHQGSGTADVYCTCELDGSGKCAKQHTTKAVLGLNPCWLETCDIDHFAAGDNLSFSVYDKQGCESRPHHFLGAVEIRSERFLPDGWHGELELKDHSTEPGTFTSRGWLRLKVDVDVKVDLPAASNGRRISLCADDSEGTSADDVSPSSSCFFDQSTSERSKSSDVKNPVMTIHKLRQVQANEARSSDPKSSSSLAWSQRPTNDSSCSSSPTGVPSKSISMPASSSAASSLQAFGNPASLLSVQALGRPQSADLHGASSARASQFGGVSRRQSCASNMSRSSIRKNSQRKSGSAHSLALVEIRLQAKMEHWSTILVEKLERFRRPECPPMSMGTMEEAMSPRSLVTEDPWREPKEAEPKEAAHP